MVTETLKETILEKAQRYAAPAEWEGLIALLRSVAPLARPTIRMGEVTAVQCDQMPDAVKFLVGLPVRGGR